MRYAAAVIVSLVLLAACGGGGNTAEEGSGGGDGTESAAADSGCGESTGLQNALDEVGDMDYEERIATIEEKAKEEGIVLLYSSSNLDQQEATADDFADAYPDGPELIYVRAKSENLSERLSLEARAGRHLADVVDQNSVAGQALRDEGLIADHEGIPIPPEYPEKYVGEWNVVNTINPNLIAWNTDMVKAGDEPSSYDDLLDPKWKGKVAVDIGSETFVAGLVHERGEEGAEEYLNQLVVENEALVRDGHSTISELLAAGEFPVSIETYAHHVAGLQEEGAPLAWAAPDPTPANASGPSLYACAPHPYGALLVMNYLLSERGSQMTADTGRVPTHPDVELLYPDLQVFVEEDSEEFEKLLPITPEIAEATFNKAYELMEGVLAPRLVETPEEDE